MYVSMLHSLVQAMGGHLELRAVFEGEEPIEITGLDGSGTLADLKDLLNRKCEIQPIPPDLEYNEFFLRSVDESVVTFQKGSNSQYLDIPTRRIAEVVPATVGAAPVVYLKGSLAWSAQKKLWQFRPTIGH